MCKKHKLTLSILFSTVLILLFCCACNNYSDNENGVNNSTGISESSTMTDKREDLTMNDKDILETWTGTYHTVANTAKVQGNLEIFKAEDEFYYAVFNGDINEKVLHAKFFIDENADDEGNTLYALSLTAYLEGNKNTDYEINDVVFCLTKEDAVILTKVNTSQSVSDWQEVFVKG